MDKIEQAREYIKKQILDNVAPVPTNEHCKYDCDTCTKQEVVECYNFNFVLKKR